MNDRQFELLMEKLEMLTQPTVAVGPSSETNLYNLSRGYTSVPNEMLEDMKGKQGVINTQAAAIRSLHKNVETLKQARIMSDREAKRMRASARRQGDTIVDLNKQIRVQAVIIENQNKQVAMDPRNSGPAYPASHYTGCCCGCCRLP
jgi:hypothetical protein